MIVGFHLEMGKGECNERTRHSRTDESVTEFQLTIGNLINP